MPRFKEIYQKHAAEYDALVSREDYQGNILTALQEIRPLDKLDAVEFGAGTGRLSTLLAPHVRSLLVTDISAHMLGVAVDKLSASRKKLWSAAVTDNRRFPVKANAVDLSVAGWSFGHATAWEPNWRIAISFAVDEMLRVLKSGGTAVIFETMGTGSETPEPPSPVLAKYYRWLERVRGFDYTWIRTDYQFESLDEAERLTRFFFGDEMGDAVVANDWVTLPECTGIWWRTV